MRTLAACLRANSRTSGHEGLSPPRHAVSRPNLQGCGSSCCHTTTPALSLGLRVPGVAVARAQPWACIQMSCHHQ
jgi:hypothetical protein